MKHWFWLFVIGIAFAQMSSTNYRVDDLTIASGANMSSTNYQSELMVGDVVGSTASTNYKTDLGFFYGLWKYSPISVTPGGAAGGNLITIPLMVAALIVDQPLSSGFCFVGIILAIIILLALYSWYKDATRRFDIEKEIPKIGED